ncbi:MAG: PaaI family thioesterase [Pikeienuella sp.]
MSMKANSPADFPSPEEMAAMSGLEFMTRIKDGTLPHAPMAQTLNYQLDTVEQGRVVFSGVPGFASYNPIGSVHGGWYGTLLDSCMGCAVQTMLPAGRVYTTLEYKVNVLRSASVETGRLYAIGEVVRVGRRTGVAEGRIEDEKGKLFATATTTCLVFEIGPE